jgi:hypothetical protein
MAEHVVPRATDRWQNNLSWKTWQTDMGRPIRCSLLMLKHKEHLKISLSVAGYNELGQTRPKLTVCGLLIHTVWTLKPSLRRTRIRRWFMLNREKLGWKGLHYAYVVLNTFLCHSVQYCDTEKFWCCKIRRVTGLCCKGRTEMGVVVRLFLPYTTSQHGYQWLHHLRLSAQFQFQLLNRVRLASTSTFLFWLQHVYYVH